METIISVLNLKNGVGASILTWNLAHILELDIYQHEKAMHHLFLKERVRKNATQSNNIAVHPIDKRKFKSGVYDLGADINYGYVQQILKASRVIVIPVELGAEVFIKTMATIKYVSQHNSESDIYIVFNKLDNSNPKREKKYTKEIQETIEGMDSNLAKRIQFYYLRYAYAMFRHQAEGYCLLDNYLLESFDNHSNISINNFRLLQHLRYYTLKRMSDSDKKREKFGREKEQSDFFKRHEPYYKEFESNFKVSKFFDGTFIGNNTKLIKDMLILATRIKGNYSMIWEKKQND